jgi:hypothetical protein
MSEAKNKWTEEWPQTPGMYWFYGCRSSWRKTPELYAMKVAKGANCMIYVCDGAFLFKGEGATGKFLPMVLPELPDEVKQ